MLAWFKFQAKIPSHSGVCVQGEWQKYTLPSPPLSEDEGLKDIGHNMSIGNLVYSITVSYLIRYDYKMRQLFHYNMRKKFITKCVRFFIRKCVRFFIRKYDGFITKCKQLLQIATTSLQNATFVTNCDSTTFIHKETVSKINREKLMKFTNNQFTLFY